PKEHLKKWKAWYGHSPSRRRALAKDSTALARLRDGEWPYQAFHFFRCSFGVSPTAPPPACRPLLLQRDMAGSPPWIKHTLDVPFSFECSVQLLLNVLLQVLVLSITINSPQYG